MTAIRGLKQEMGRLKNIMEHPDYGREAVIMPSESTRLWYTRLYLDRAKQAVFMCRQKRNRKQRCLIPAFRLFAMSLSYHPNTCNKIIRIYCTKFRIHTDNRTFTARDNVNTQVSHVLKSINLDKSYEKGTLRILLGKENIQSDAIKIADSLIRILKH